MVVVEGTQPVSVSDSIGVDVFMVFMPTGDGRAARVPLTWGHRQDAHGTGQPGRGHAHSTARTPTPGR
jgi:hypothetical protein